MKAGIKQYDIILLIDGDDYDNYELGIESLRGKPGTKVSVNVYREETDETIDFSIIRRKIDVPSVDYEMIDEITGFITITHFDMGTFKQLKSAYNKLISEGMQQLIIDLCYNPGGTLNSCVEIASFFTDTDYIVYTENKYGEQVYYYADEKSVDIPLIVLVNEYSASASEIFAAAIQDTGAGLIIGSQTYGKGVVQQIFHISDGSEIIITVSEYFTPAGISIHGIGITPDIEVDGTDTDAMIEAALKSFPPVKKSQPANIKNTKRN
jgi:carboxyl-terminal processing protease